MLSLRDSGKIVGRSVSIKQLARQCNLSFPLSLRRFITTPGCPFSRCIRLHTKVLCYPYGLLLKSVASSADLPIEGRQLVIVALVGAALHIRIFDFDGKRVVDKGEDSLIRGDTLTILKERLDPVTIDSFLSLEQIQEFIRNATSVSGHNASAPIETMLERMREVYSTAGIRVVVASREILTATALGSTNFNTLNDLDVGRCQGASSSEQNQLFQNQNHVPAGQRDKEIVVYFVRSVTETNGGGLNGCASFPTGQPGAVISQIASRWTLAHEVGHVLGLDHISGEHTNCPDADPQCCSTPGVTRLMTGCSTSKIVGTPTVDQNEINAMTSSPLTRQC